MRAYYHDNLDTDQRLPHDSGKSLTDQQLRQLGVLAFHFENQADVDNLALHRFYKNRDVVTISPTSFGDAYDAKLEVFYAEHLHEDEEIRYVLDGEGYFDVRDSGDKWIRCHLAKGDLLILPEGIYHRFTPGESDYIQAMRLFQDEPKWVAHGRSSDTDGFNSRKDYLQKIGLA